MVTVEMCVGFVLAIVLTAVLAAVSLLGIAHAAAAEASAQLARQAARADEVAFKEARERVPDGARVEVERQAGGVEATVTIAARVPVIGAIDVSAKAWSAYEPGVGP